MKSILKKEIRYVYYTCTIRITFEIEDTKVMFSV